MIYLILLFTLVPLIELGLLLKLGAWIGVLPTIFIVGLTGVIGAILAKLQGLEVLNRIRESISEGIPPSEHFLDGGFILAGGLLLLTPGLITDLLGLFALIPFTRHILKLILKRKIKLRFHRKGVWYESKD